MHSSIPSHSELAQHQNFSAQVSADNPRLSMWLSKLPNYVLPLNGTMARRVISEINDDNSTAEKLALIIRQDPTLCLKLYLKAKRQLKDKDGNIQGLVHLIGLLGFDQIKQVVRSAPKQKDPSPGQQELLSASLFAADLATRLLPEKHGTRGERFHLPALFFNAPLWLMWAAAPKLMDHGQTRASKHKQKLKPLCEKTLGFSLHSLLEQTQAFLALPKLSLDSLAVDYSKDIEFWLRVRRSTFKDIKSEIKDNKNAKKILYSAEAGINIINHLVLAIYLDWHGKHIQRWTRLLSNHLSLPEDDVKDIIMEVATQLHSPADDDAGDSLLSGRFSPLYRYRQLHKAMPPDLPTGNDTIILQYMDQLSKVTQSNKCFQLALEALSKGVQAEHCLLLKINKEQINIALSFGFIEANKESHQLESTLQVNINECGPLINKLMTKPMAISVDGSQLTILKQQLPQALTQLWAPRPCGIMSLFYDNEPYAIVICDHKDWNNEQQVQFKRIGKQLAQSLKQCEI